MRAVLIEKFGDPPRITMVGEPHCGPDDVILAVEATGLCRSDWHAWQGHDPDVVLPHVPGHEIAGTVAHVGAAVLRWTLGDRVTVPFVCACGNCRECVSGNAQTCLNQQQPGFTYWGSFAERVAIPHADFNLVALPPEIGFVAAAALGCRLATAYRAVRQVGQMGAGESLAVFGCGGVGLSAVMVAAAGGTHVLGIDPSEAALTLARMHGAEHVLSTVGLGMDAIVSAVRGHSLQGAASAGVDATMDAIGASSVVDTALRCLRPRGRHLQVGLLPGHSVLSMGALLGAELRLLGSHGMPASGYADLLAEIAAGLFSPAALVTAEIGLEQVPEALIAMSSNSSPGITVIHP